LDGHGLMGERCAEVCGTALLDHLKFALHSCSDDDVKVRRRCSRLLSTHLTTPDDSVHVHTTHPTIVCAVKHLWMVDFRLGFRWVLPVVCAPLERHVHRAQTRVLDFRSR